MFTLTTKYLQIKWRNVIRILTQNNVHISDTVVFCDSEPKTILSFDLILVLSQM